VTGTGKESVADGDGIKKEFDGGVGSNEALYHSANPIAVNAIIKNRFRIDLPNPQAAFKNNRFGSGVYLTDSSATALLERPGRAILKIQADSGRNLNVVNRGIMSYDMGQAVARGSKNMVLIP
jgi:hypothetical protein